METSTSIIKSSFAILLATSALLSSSSCEDFIEIDPPKTEITAETVFTNDAAAISAIRGIYSLMMSNQSFTKGEIDRYTGLSSDELINYSSNEEQQQFFLPGLQANNSAVFGVFWNEPYKYILNANAMLEGLDRSKGISSQLRDQLEGEARFIRAFCYFYLVNLFGDVPSVMSTDFRLNGSAPRMSTNAIYAQIIKDLTIAESAMAEDFSFSGDERTQPNKWAATALLARVYLFVGDWENALEKATTVLENSSLFALEADLSRTFLKDSKEAIWQLKPVVPGVNTFQGQMFILTSPPANALGKVSLSNAFINSIEPNDIRGSSWTGSYSDGTNIYYFPYKYKASYSASLTEYNTVMRLAEQYLIRAEARAHLGDISGAREDLNMLRSRAGLSGTAADNVPALLLAVEQERKIELFAEWGHRWLDLKRTHRAHDILSLTKADWQATDALYPVPESERLVNPNLGQNPGY